MNWQRVTKSKPCPICGKPDWCGLSASGAVVHCMRVTSSRPCRTSAGGWFHRMVDAPATPRVVEYTRPAPIEGPTIDAEAIARQCYGHTSFAMLADLHRKLGVSIASLQRLRAGWFPSFSAWAFPMEDGQGRTIGIRLRNDAAKKWAIRGSKNGLFVPRDLMGEGPLMLCEGPTDCAALLDLGFDAVGRPGCSIGAEQIRDLLQRWKRRDVVICGDRDESKPLPGGGSWRPGQQGAEDLARKIQACCRSLKIIYPLVGKDVRAWYQAGATRATILLRIQGARFFRDER